MQLSWDNAVTETLFGSLKVERLHGERFETIRQAKDAVLGWLLWYNRSTHALDVELRESSRVRTRLERRCNRGCRIKHGGDRSRWCKCGNRYNRFPHSHHHHDYDGMNISLNQPAK
jgi:hypothetical protein